MLDELYWRSRLNMHLQSKQQLKGLYLRLGNWAMGPASICMIIDALSYVKNPRVLEFGLGESTRVISRFSPERHLVIEHDASWAERFKSSYVDKSIPEISIFPSLTNEGSSSYDFGPSPIDFNYNIFVIDGPFGSQKNSRSNILDIINGWSVDQRFVIILDDVHRPGELQTFINIKALLEAKEIGFKSKKISDLKKVGLICSEHYWPLISL